MQNLNSVLPQQYLELGRNGLLGQKQPKICLKTTKCKLSANSWIHVFYLSLMFSLHLYKNTEYSRVFTQLGNCDVCSLAPRLISCPEPFDSSTRVDWNGRPKPRSRRVFPQCRTTGQPPEDQYLSAVILPDNARRCLWPSTSEALTKAGEWETMFLSMFCQCFTA